MAIYQGDQIAHSTPYEGVHVTAKDFALRIVKTGGWVLPEENIFCAKEMTDLQLNLRFFELHGFNRKLPSPHEVEV